MRKWDKWPVAVTMLLRLFFFFPFLGVREGGWVEKTFSHRREVAASKCKTDTGQDSSIINSAVSMLLIYLLAEQHDRWQ